MEILHERCCGLDVHKKNITACIITPERKEIRTFETMTRKLMELVDWVYLTFSLYQDFFLAIFGYIIFKALP